MFLMIRWFSMTLGIGDFDSVRQNFVAFAETQRNYKKNRFQIAPEIADTIAKRWSWYIERYGYQRPEE